MDGRDAVYRSLEMIEKRIADRLTVEVIARDAHFSRFHYGRLFREAVGESVMAYVQKRRLTLAGQALLEGEDTVLDIALRFGYDSHEGFARSFKAYMGVTPTEYRRYRLSAIAQPIAKEWVVMTYSSTAQQVMREMNGFIADAKEVAEQVRKHGSHPDQQPWKDFWYTIADATDTMSDKVQSALDRIHAITQKPDEITNRFTILKTMEDNAFTANLMSFNVSLMVSRGHPGNIDDQQPLCDRYVSLARTSAMKADRVAGYMNELAALILADMRKAADKKINALIERGNAAIEGISGYTYIKRELTVLVSALESVQREDITVSLLEDLLFKLSIIAFAADMDAFRMPPHRTMFEGIYAFKDAMSDTIAFFQTLLLSDTSDLPASPKHNPVMDIMFQTNIFYFYTMGEVEKISALLDDKQKSAFEDVCSKTGKLLDAMRSAVDSGNTVYDDITKRLSGIRDDMLDIAKGLGKYGGPTAFLADQYGHLADSVRKLANID